MVVLFGTKDRIPWLASEPSWQSRMGEGWRRTKCLGKGANGVAGLWEFQGDPAKKPAITQDVVEQSEFNMLQPRETRLGGKSAIDEGDLGRKMATGCRLVGIYGAMFCDRGAPNFKTPVSFHAYSICLSFKLFSLLTQSFLQEENIN